MSKVVRVVLRMDDMGDWVEVGEQLILNGFDSGERVVVITEEEYERLKEMASRTPVIPYDEDEEDMR